MVHLVYCCDKSKELSKILDGCKWCYNMVTDK